MVLITGSTESLLSFTPKVKDNRNQSASNEVSLTGELM